MHRLAVVLAFLPAQSAALPPAARSAALRARNASDSNCTYLAPSGDFYDLTDLIVAGGGDVRTACRMHPIPPRAAAPGRSLGLSVPRSLGPSLPRSLYLYFVSLFSLSPGSSPSRSRARLTAGALCGSVQWTIGDTQGNSTYFWNSCAGATPRGSGEPDLVCGEGMAACVTGPAAGEFYSLGRLDTSSFREARPGFLAISCKSDPRSSRSPAFLSLSVPFCPFLSISVPFFTTHGRSRVIF